MDLLVARNDLRRIEWRETPPPEAVELAPGQILVEVERFAFTANNITYAVAKMPGLDYWQFFPAPDGFGRIPVWGFARVIRTAHPAITEGERLFGYVPMSTHFVIDADRVHPARLIDNCPARSSLHPVYNQYARLSGDPAHEPALEDHQALLRPLFITSFLIDDLLAEENFFGARTVLIGSASSKTATGLAALVKKRSAFEVVGLTSPANAAFVSGVGFYDRVVLYNDISELDAALPAVFVDLGGNSAVRAAIHRRFHQDLAFSLSVGMTHWEALPDSAGEQLAGPRPVFFFSPDRIRKRTKDWGPGEVDRRFGEAFSAYVPQTRSWLDITRRDGPDAVAAAYAEVLSGHTPPNIGYMLSLHA